MSGVPDPDLLPIGQVVAEVQASYPDVTHSSLRFLEREGLITPTRTAGGHRLFARHDVERIRQIKTWQAQRLSLDQIRQRLLDLDRLSAPAALAESFLQLALDGNQAAAYQSIIKADDLGVPLTRLFGEVLQPALSELGRRWEHGELLVAQEKEVSELARDLIADLPSGTLVPPQRGRRWSRPASRVSAMNLGCAWSADCSAPRAGRSITSAPTSHPASCSKRFRSTDQRWSYFR